MNQSPICVDDFEKYAYSVLSKKALDFYRGGAGAETTLLQNRKAFSRYKIRPRCLRNVANRDLTTTVLGQKIEIPIGICPMAPQKMAHPEGECATARAAQEMGTVFMLSSQATSSIEEVAAAAPLAIKWLQIFIFSDRNITKNFVERAEKGGFKAIVVTVDTPVLGRRLADMRNKFSLPPHLKFANYPDFVDKSDVYNYFNNLFDQSLEWKDIKWLQGITKLPVIIKGILTAEDAIIAADLGVSAIIVSNHGGRQLDGTPATIEALPEIVKAVGHRIEIYMDGGVTDGTDVLKALVLGARMVSIGRPAIWGLTHSGKEGVKKVVDILRTELDYALAISGCATLNDLSSEMVVPEGYYSKL